LLFFKSSWSEYWYGNQQFGDNSSKKLKDQVLGGDGKDLRWYFLRTDSEKHYRRRGLII
jgi:hypothetical protein